jgi:hypothetical protein
VRGCRHGVVLRSPTPGQCGRRVTCSRPSLISCPYPSSPSARIVSCARPCLVHAAGAHEHDRDRPACASTRSSSGAASGTAGHWKRHPGLHDRTSVISSVVEADQPVGGATPPPRAALLVATASVTVGPKEDLRLAHQANAVVESPGPPASIGVSAGAPFKLSQLTSRWTPCLRPTWTSELSRRRSSVLAMTLGAR